MRLPPAALLIVALASACTPAEGAGELVTQQYSASFRLSTPADWVVRHDVGGMRLVAASPQTGPEDPFTENVNVMLEGLAEGVSLKEYAEGQMAQLQHSAVDVVVFEAADRTLGGQQARRIVFEHTVEGRRLRVVTYVVVRSERAYVLTATALAETFDEYLPVMERIAGTFRT